MKSILRVFASWRMAVVMLTGFSCGIPLKLTGGTLQGWMKKENVDLTTIGLFALVGLPYTLKFLWSPIMDRFVPPGLGRRRGWMVISQLLILLATCTLAFSSPGRAPGMVAFIALLVAFFSASQDIVVDAYKIEILKPSEYGAGAGLYIMGYRLAMIISGALALIMADHMSWRAVYLIMASTMAIGLITTLLAPEPPVDVLPPKSLREAVVLPFVEFLKRRGAIEMLIFIVIYKMDTNIATAITTPFMLEIGFSLTDIGVVTNGFGLVATIVGAIMGGAIMSRIGLKKSLWVFGILQGISGFSFMMLARLGHNYPMMVTAIAVENVCAGLGVAALAAFTMGLCDKRFTATQSALLTSLMAVSRVVLSAPAGYMAKGLGWEQYFLVSILIAIPGLLLLLRYDTWHKLDDQGHAGSASAEPAR